MKPQDYPSTYSISSSSNTTADAPEEIKIPELDYNSLGFVESDPNALSGMNTAVPPVVPDNINDIFPASDLSTVSQTTATFIQPRCSDPSHLLYNQRRPEPDNIAAAIHAALPQFNHSQLSHMSSLLRDIQLCIGSMLQPRLDSEAQSAPSPTSQRSAVRARYFCQLCKPGTGAVYKSLGSFKRHVGDEHQHRYQYRCPYNECTWVKYRKDKIHEHLRNKHEHRKRTLTQQEIKLFERAMPPPQFCEICMTPVSTWEEYFRCVANHCRLPEGDHPSSSTGDRRDSNGGGGSGGSHNGYNGQNFQDPGFFGGMGNPSYFNGNSAGGGNSFYSGYGQGFTSCNGDCTDVPGFVDTTGQRYFCSIDRKSDMGSVDQMGHGSWPSAKNHPQASVPGTTGPSEPVQSVESSVKNAPAMMPSSDGTPARHLRPSSHLNKPPSKILPFPDSIQPPKLGPGSTDIAPDKREQRDASQREYETCGHILDGCSRCELLKQVADLCHLCVGKCLVLNGARISQYLRNYDQFQDFACNGVSNRVCSALRIHETVVQALQLFHPAGCLLPGRMSGELGSETNMIPPCHNPVYMTDYDLDLSLYSTTCSNVHAVGKAISATGSTLKMQNAQSQYDQQERDSALRTSLRLLLQLQKSTADMHYVAKKAKSKDPPASNVERRCFQECSLPGNPSISNPHWSLPRLLASAMQSTKLMFAHGTMLPLPLPIPVLFKLNTQYRQQLATAIFHGMVTILAEMPVNPTSIAEWIEEYFRVCGMPWIWKVYV